MSKKKTTLTGLPGATPSEEGVCSERKRSNALATRQAYLQNEYSLSDTQATLVMELESLPRNEWPTRLQGYSQALVDNGLKCEEGTLEKQFVDWIKRDEADPELCGAEALEILVYMFDTLGTDQAEAKISASLRWRIQRLLSPWQDAEVRAVAQGDYAGASQGTFVGFTTNTRVTFILDALLETGLYGRSRSDVIDRLLSEVLRREIDGGGYLGQVIMHRKAMHPDVCGEDCIQCMDEEEEEDGDD